jgi:hypothetical protein
MAALAKDPDKRPATCADLVSRMRTAFRVDRPAIRSRARRAATLAAVVVAAVIVASVLLLRGQAGPRAGPAAESRAGTIVTLAGTGESGSSGDGGPAAWAKLAQPFAVAADRTGNVYVSEGLGGRVRRIDRQGVITTVAGIGEAVSVGYPWDPPRPDLGIDPAG